MTANEIIDEQIKKLEWQINETREVLTGLSVSLSRLKNSFAYLIKPNELNANEARKLTGLQSCLSMRYIGDGDLGKTWRYLICDKGAI